MSRKIAILTLRYVPGTSGDSDHFIVVKVQESTDYLPGARLSKTQTDTLARSASWKVTITG